MRSSKAAVSCRSALSGLDARATVDHVEHVWRNSETFDPGRLLCCRAPRLWIIDAKRIHDRDWDGDARAVAPVARTTCFVGATSIVVRESDGLPVSLRDIERVSYVMIPLNVITEIEMSQFEIKIQEAGKVERASSAPSRQQ